MTDNLNLDYMLRAEIAVERFGKTGLIYFADQQRMMEINNIGLTVLECIKNNKSGPEISQSLSRFYEADQQKIKNDLETLLIDLMANEVIVLKCSHPERYNIFRYKRRNTIESFSEKDSYCLINPDSREKLKLNPTGWYLWGKLQIPRSISDLVTCQYIVFKAIDLEMCFSDTYAYCSKLVRKGFIREVDSGFESL